MIPNILYANFNSKTRATNPMRFKNKREKEREREGGCGREGASLRREFDLHT